jgi:DNA-binding MarR family transcriptional regulator
MTYGEDNMARDLKEIRRKLKDIHNITDRKQMKSRYIPTYKNMMDNGYRQIPKEILFYLMGGGLKGSEIRIFLYIYHETYGYKESIRHHKYNFSYDMIRKHTGYSNSTIERTLKSLTEKKIIEKTRGDNKKIEIEILLSQWTRWDMSNAKNIGKENGIDWVFGIDKDEENIDGEDWNNILKDV